MIIGSFQKVNFIEQKSLVDFENPRRLEENNDEINNQSNHSFFKSLLLTKLTESSHMSLSVSLVVHPHSLVAFSGLATSLGTSPILLAA